MAYLVDNDKKYAIAILIPVYNSVDYLAGCLDSILAQTFKDYKIVLFDDHSTDGSDEIVKKYMADYPNLIVGVQNLGEQRWNGGARNALMNYCPTKVEYVLFMDSDDKFVDDTVLQRVWDFTLEQGCPDVTRLSYTKKNPDGGVITKIIKDTTPAEMAHNSKVAPWTKLVKKKFLGQVCFPENTLFEDVVHHIALSDIVETVASTDFPVIEWNRCNPRSASTAITPKRMSSAFRFVADLMDLNLTKSYTEERKAIKIRDACNNLGLDFDNVDWRKVCC